MQFKTSVGNGMNNCSFFNNVASQIVTPEPESNLLASSTFSLASQNANKGAKTSSDLLLSISNQFNDAQLFIDGRARDLVAQTIKNRCNSDSGSAIKNANPFGDSFKSSFPQVMTLSGKSTSISSGKSSKSGSLTDGIFDKAGVNKNEVDKQLKEAAKEEEKSKVVIVKQPQKTQNTEINPDNMNTDSNKEGVAGVPDVDCKAEKDKEKEIMEELKEAKQSTEENLNTLSKIHSDAVLCFKNLKAFSEAKELMTSKEYYQTSDKTGETTNSSAEDSSKNDNRPVFGKLVTMPSMQMAT